MNEKISRQDFMNFFRNDKTLNLLTADDRLEIFSQVLLGQSDLTKKLLDNVLNDYCVENLKILEIQNEK